jgi:hypothetical protein
MQLLIVVLYIIQLNISKILLSFHLIIINRIRLNGKIYYNIKIINFVCLVFIKLPKSIVFILRTDLLFAE